MHNPPVYEISVSPGGLSHKSVVWSRKHGKSTLARLSGRPYFPITWNTKSQPQIICSKIWIGASNIPFSVLKIWRIWHSDDRLFEKSKMLRIKLVASHFDLKKIFQWPQCAHDGIHLEKLCSKVVSDPRMRWQLPANDDFCIFVRYPQFFEDLPHCQIEKCLILMSKSTWKNLHWRLSHTATICHEIAQDCKEQSSCSRKPSFTRIGSWNLNYFKVPGTSPEIQTFRLRKMIFP